MPFWEGVKGGKIEDESEYKPVMFLGKDIQKVPCFRTSLIYSIYAGVFVALGYSFATGKMMKAVDYSIYTFIGVTTAIWIPCRWDHSNRKIEVAQMTKLVQERALTRGTEKDQFNENESAEESQ